MLVMHNSREDAVCSQNGVCGVVTFIIESAKNNGYGCELGRIEIGVVNCKLIHILW